MCDAVGVHVVEAYTVEVYAVDGLFCKVAGSVGSDIW